MRSCVDETCGPVIGDVLAGFWAAIHRHRALSTRPQNLARPVDVVPSLGRMQPRVVRRSGGEIEDLVGQRLRDILAAANPRVGWVPGPVVREGDQPVAAQADPPTSPDAAGAADGLAPRDGADPARTPTEVTQRASPASVPSDSGTPEVGRHRGAVLHLPRWRWAAGRQSALAMCLVAVLVGLLSAGVTWWSRPEPSSTDPNGMQVVAGSSAASSSVGSSPATGSGPESGAGPAADQLVVSVIGQVRQPGLVTVPDGARVADALTAAGGALPEADLSTVNLARLLVDGEQIAVGMPGSSLPGADPSVNQGSINLNTASQTELESLPGIGPVLAQRIIDFRGDGSGFTGVEQLREVSGIGPTLYEDIVDLVTV